MRARKHTYSNIVEEIDSKLLKFCDMKTFVRNKISDKVINNDKFPQE